MQEGTCTKTTSVNYGRMSAHRKKTCKNRCKSLQTALTVVYMPTLVDAGDKVMNKTWYGLAFIDPTC